MVDFTTGMEIIICEPYIVNLHCKIRLTIVRLSFIINYAENDTEEERETMQAEKSKSKFSIKDLTLIALMTAVTCVLGPLSIPIPVSPVPISFTNLAIYLTVMLLGWKRGTISYIVYLFIGLVGVPVFSAFTAGPQKLLGPTGGYLIGFIFMAIIAGLFIEKFDGKIPMYFVGMVLGTIVTYAFGSAWLAYEAGMTFKAAIVAGVLFYIPGDVAKMIIAAVLGGVIRKRLKRADLI